MALGGSSVAARSWFGYETLISDVFEYALNVRVESNVIPRIVGLLRMRMMLLSMSSSMGTSLVKIVDGKKVAAQYVAHIRDVVVYDDEGTIVSIHRKTPGGSG